MKRYMLPCGCVVVFEKMMMKIGSCRGSFCLADTEYDPRFHKQHKLVNKSFASWKMASNQ